LDTSTVRQTGPLWRPAQLLSKDLGSTEDIPEITLTMPTGPQGHHLSKWFSGQIQLTESKQSDGA
jgi:hypothetical protein